MTDTPYFDEYQRNYISRGQNNLDKFDTLSDNNILLRHFRDIVSLVAEDKAKVTSLIRDYSYDNGSTNTREFINITIEA
jgi:hypothetical protein